MTDVRDWSVTAASNTDIAPEGMAPSAVNDAIRTVQASVAKLQTDMKGTIATTGSSNAYNITLATTPSSLADGLFFSFTANHTNTGAATLAVTPNGASAFTTKALRKNGSSADIALGAGDIVSGNRYQVQYEASANATAGAYIVLNPTFSSVVSATDITPGAATHEITLPSGFEAYEIIVRGLFPTTNNTFISMQVKVGGVWITTSTYYESIAYISAANTRSTVTRTTVAAWQLSLLLLNEVDEGCFGRILLNVGTFSYPSILARMSAWIPALNVVDLYDSNGFVTNAGPIEAVRLFSSSGTLGGGRVILSGYRVA